MVYKIKATITTRRAWKTRQGAVRNLPKARKVKRITNARVVKV